MSAGDRCPACGEEYMDIEVAVMGGTVGPVPEGAVDVCVHVISAPVPGVVLLWHDEEIEAVRDDVRLHGVRAEYGGEDVDG